MRILPGATPNGLSRFASLVFVIGFAGRLKAPLHIKRRLEKRIQETAAELFDIEVCDDRK